MASIGTVNIVSGKVFIEDIVGNQRVVAQGDDILMGDQIFTELNSHIDIQLLSGRMMSLENGDTWLPTYEMYANNEGFLFDSRMDTDVNALQDAMLAGVDPTSISPATAAGESTAQIVDTKVFLHDIIIAHYDTFLKTGLSENKLSTISDSSLPLITNVSLPLQDASKNIESTTFNTMGKLLDNEPLDLIQATCNSKFNETLNAVVNLTAEQLDIINYCTQLLNYING